MLSTSSRVWFPVMCALSLAGLAGCMAQPTQQAAMTSEPAAPLPQAPAQTPQPVKTPLPPATKGPAVPPADAPAASAPPASRSAPSVGGPYVGAQLGYSRARNANFQEDNPAAANCFLFATATGCGGILNSAGSSAVLGLSAGYRFGPFRADVSYQRRGGYNLSGWDPAGTYFDPPITSNAMIVSGFYDFPTKIGGWFQPYVGLGLGASRNEMKALKWNDPTCCTGMLNGGGSTTSPAWQGTLGAAISLDSLAKGLILDIAFRYTDMGEFKKPAGFDQAGNFNGTGTTASATGNLRANEFLFGMRWEY
ncbi:MAG: outer membrane protein [Burkholderiales bacterium]